MRAKQLRDVCPSGIDKCHCLYKNGTYVTGPFYYDEDPVGSVVTYVGCNPDFCYCKDSPKVARDARPIELAAVMDLCPAGEMDRCLCHDNAVANFPFDMATFFFECRPRRCKCKNDKKVKKVTALGCADGGIPYCPNIVDKHYFCKDGSKVFLNQLLEYQRDGQEGCICKDGIAPRCSNTGDLVQCPDGSHIDLSFGKPGNFLDGCKEDKWEFT